MHGPRGGQCDEENFSYPWRDNYCEKREWDMPLCPGGQGHQGQDIRAATCQKARHWVVAATDGIVTTLGTYSLYLTAPDGTRFEYLHMSDIAVREGDSVTRGERLGKVSNEFNGTPTTVHLHFNIRQNVLGLGFIYVPPYASLVEAYERLLGLRQEVPETIEPRESAPESAPPAAGAAVTAPPEPPRVVAHVAAEVERDESGGCAQSGGPRRGRADAAIAASLALAAFGRRRTRRATPARARRTSP